MSNSNEAKARAEASFERKQERAREGTKAWAEYQAQRRYEAEKTERLRALRLAKEAAESAERAKKSAAPTTKRSRRVTPA
jgi:hypothetical protein